MHRLRFSWLVATLVLTGSVTAQQAEPAIPMMADSVIDEAIQTLEERLDAPGFEEDPAGTLSMPIYSFGGAILRGGMLSEAQEKRLVDYLEDLRKRAPAASDRIDRHIFQVKNLTIGKTAPDIVAEDLDEVPFKLSDYRGKVVVLDFWGDW